MFKKGTPPPMDYLVKHDQFNSQKLHWEYSVRAQMVPVLFKKKQKQNQKNTQNLTSYDCK